MKTFRLLALLFAFFTLNAVNAQDNDDQMKMLFPKKENANKTVSNGGYGAFSFGYSNINDQDAILIGGRGAWVANHRFALGLAGYGFFSNIDNNGNNYNSNPSEYSLAGGYGGLFFEPIIAPNYPVHVSFPILFGSGGVTAANWDFYNNNYHNNNYYNNYYYNSDWFLVFEPGVDVEFNIVKFFRLALGVSYRLTNGIDLQYKYFDEFNVEQTIDIPNDALNSFNYNITFKFGWF